MQGLYNRFSHWSSGNGVFILGDTHFGEQDLKDAYPMRPSDEELVKRINSKAGKDSTLIILGDVGDVSYVRKLRAAYKILILGNHDLGATKYKREFAFKRYDANIWTKQEAIKDMEKLYPGWNLDCSSNYSDFLYWGIKADNGLFNEVYAGPLMINEKILLSHEPIPNCSWVYNCHAHVHDPHIKDDTYHFNFNIDGKQHYEPWNFNQWLKEGHTSKIQSLHRQTIDGATKRKESRK